MRELEQERVLGGPGVVLITGDFAVVFFTFHYYILWHASSGILVTFHGAGDEQKLFSDDVAGLSAGKLCKA